MRKNRNYTKVYQFHGTLFLFFSCQPLAQHARGRRRNDVSIRTPSGAVKEVILRVTERAQKEVIARVGLGFGRCCP
jgi:hypothetical protein